MRLPGQVQHVVDGVRYRLPFGHPTTAPGSTLPFMSQRPSVKPILPVGDMEAATAFYRGLGFEVVAYDAGYAWVKNCGWEVWHLGAAAGLDAGTNAAAAYLHVSDANEWRAALAAAADGDDVVSEVSDTPWGMREFSFTDPSGNLIRVGQNI